MPNKNGTGPRGKGSRTGRGLGNCGPKKRNTKSSRPLRKNLRNRR